jgi:hypothetical protein
MSRRVVWQKYKDFSDEPTVSVFRVEKYAKKTKSNINLLSAALKIEVVQPYETSLNFRQATQCHIPEDSMSILYGHRCGSFKFHSTC